MWQNIFVFLVIFAAAGFTAWRFYQKFSGKESCCGGGCTCKSKTGAQRSAGCGCSGKGPKDGVRRDLLNRELSPLGCSCAKH